MTTDPHMEALLVGIDAGCLPVLERLFGEGRIPTIESICTTGACSPLTSQIPPWTPSAWPSMYTGVNPGKHGVFGFVDFDGYDWRVVTADDVREYTLWELLDFHGVRSVVVNAPVTHPPPAIDGAIVPGFIGPEDPTCHPAGLLSELREAIGGYRVYPTYSRGDDEFTDAEKMAEYASLIRMRGDAFRYLAREFDPEFGFVQFQKPDTVFHEFEGDWEKVRAVYEETDAQVEAIIDEFDPLRVFIASDHGIGPYDRYEFRVNEFLAEAGYVSVTSGGKGMPSWNPIRSQLREGRREETWEPGILERAAGTAARIGVRPTRVRETLERVGLKEVISRYLPAGVTRTTSEQVDFASSSAYLRARTELGIRINLAGRDPDGVVATEEYEAVRDELIDSLSSVTAPDGGPVFDEVVRREEYVHGRYAENAVDVFTVPADFGTFLSAQLLGDQFGPPSEPWNHKLDGVFAAKGADIDEEVDLTGAHLFDVAPTILATFGLQTSDRMDGTVLPITDDHGERSFPDYRRGGRDDADTEAVEDRLLNLGYLE